MHDIDDFDEADLTLLPESAKQLINEIGRGPALKLIKARPGIRVYVPYVLTVDHSLVKILGEADAAELVRVAAGEQFKVPACVQFRHAARNRRIRRRHAAGEKIADLCLEFGMTESQLWHICSGKPWKSGAESRIDATRTNE